MLPIQSLPNLNRPASPCRISRAAGARRHACSAHHAFVVQSFRDARANWEREREAACRGYAGDEALWLADHPGPTFREWLLAFRGQHSDDAADAA